MLDAGNFAYGTLWYAKWKGEKAVNYGNALGYDAMSAGNNEFLNGASEYVGYLKEYVSSTSHVITNMNWYANSAMTGCFKDGGVSNVPCMKRWDIVMKGGVKIGILGFINKLLFMEASPGRDISMMEEISAAEAALTELYENHPDCNIIVALSSLAESDNLVLAEEIADIDIIIGANHIQRTTQVGWCDKPYDGSPCQAESYPQVLVEADDATGRGAAIIVSAGHYGTHIGHLDVEFDAAGKISGWSAVGEGSVKLALTYNGTSELPCDGADLTPCFGAGETYPDLQEEYAEIVTFKGGEYGTTLGPVNADRGDPPMSDDGSNLCIAPTDSDACPVADPAFCSVNTTDMCSGGPGIILADDDATVSTFSGDAITGYYAYDPNEYCCGQVADGYNDGSCCPAEHMWDGYGVRHSDTPMSWLATDAMMSQCDDCDMAINNGGAIRSSIDAAGGVTYGKLLEIFPYQNTLATFEIKGMYIAQALANGVYGYAAFDDNGKFPAIAGARFVWNPITYEIVSIYMCDKWDSVPSETNPRGGTCFENKWTLLNVNSYYKVATNNYIRNGGDGYDVFSSDMEAARNINDYGLPMEDVLKNYFALNPDLLTYTKEEMIDKCTGEKNLYAEEFANNTDCRMFRSSGTSELKCPTDTDTCQNSEYFMPKADGCEACSGFGLCDETTFKCTCYYMGIDDFLNPPDSITEDDDSDSCGGGLGSGIMMHSGDACEIERTKFVLADSTQALSYVFGAINLVACIAALVFYIGNGKSKLVHNSQPKFLYMISIGGIVCFVSTCFSLMEPDSTSCHGTMWAGTVGIMMQFAALFTKTYRIHKIFNNKKLRKYTVTEADIIKFYSAFVLMTVVVLLVLTSVAPLEVNAFSLSNSYEFAYTCSAGGDDQLWVILLCFYIFSTLIWG